MSELGRRAFLVRKAEFWEASGVTPLGAGRPQYSLFVQFLAT